MSLSRHFTSLIIWFIALIACSLLATKAFSKADAALYTRIGRLSGWQSSESAQLRRAGEAVQTEQILVPTRVKDYPAVHYVRWDADMPLDLATHPQNRMQELATILHCVSRKLGVASVGVSTPLMWDDEDDEMAQLMLAGVLKSFTRVGIGIHGRNAVQAEVTPAELGHDAIPPSQVEGDTSKLPSANVPQPYFLPVTGESSLLWAPDYVEDEPLSQERAQARRLSCPLLVRWNGELLPTLPLRLALAELGLSAGDIHVRIGKSLRIGERLLPLDEHGRTPLGAGRAAEAPLVALLNSTAQADRQKSLGIIYRPLTVSQDRDRGEQMAATLSLLLAQERTTYVPTTRLLGTRVFEPNYLQSTLPGWLLCAAFFACALLWLPQLSFKARCAILAAMLIGILSLCAYWFCHGVWMSLYAWLLCWLILLIAQWALTPRKPKPERPMLWD